MFEVELRSTTNNPGTQNMNHRAGVHKCIIRFPSGGFSMIESAKMGCGTTQLHTTAVCIVGTYFQAVEISLYTAVE